jgi:RHS repeat-associated protein
VISDVKEPNATYDQFTADLKSYYNYYAFGMLQPNRLYTLAEEYKFGFNGQEVEDEISGDNNHLVFTYRIHDARLGRFMSVDPLFSSYPWNSAYSFAENDVIRCIDLEGAERFVVIISENNTGGQTTTTIEVPNENFTKEGILYVHIKNNRVYFYFQSSENVTMVQYSPERIKEKHNKNNYVSPSGHFSDEEIYVGGGGFIVGGQTIEIRTENKATGFYETSVKTKKNLTYPLEIGPSIAWGGSLQINKRVLNKLKTNSLCEVLNYPDRIESKAGGLVYGGGIIKAYKGNDLVYKLKYQGIITGFTFSNALLNDWEPGSMDGQDSLMRSEINLLEGLGNSSDYKSTRNKYKENKDED